MFRSLFSPVKAEVERYAFEHLVKYLEGKISLSDNNIEQILWNNFCDQSENREILMKFKNIITNYMTDKNFYLDAEMDLSECTIGLFNRDTLSKLITIISFCNPKHLNLSFNCLEDMRGVEFSILSTAIINLSLHSITTTHWEVWLFDQNQLDCLYQILGSGILKLNLIPDDKYSIEDDVLNEFDNIIKMNQDMAVSTPQHR